MAETNKNDEQRTKSLLEILSINDKETTITDKLKKLCVDYADIFALETDKMTVNNFYEQTLNIKDKEPVFSENYRTPHTQKEEIKKQVDKLLENEIIEKSTS